MFLKVLMIWKSRYEMLICWCRGLGSMGMVSVKVWFVLCRKVISLFELFVLFVVCEVVFMLSVDDEVVYVIF